MGKIGDTDNKKIYVTSALMPPYEEYIEAIKPLWTSHWLTNMGVYHQELESKLKEYLDVPELSLLVNGHMALELTIQMMNFPENSEIITTPFTFISTTHAIIRNGLKPVFCDVKMSDGTIDETKIESLITDKTVAILPVHVYGNVCNVEEIQRIADTYKLKVIYDAAHAFGVKYKGIGIGNYGDASIFSFHATKVFNTIEGGAVTFSNPKYYEKLYNLKNFGIRGEELVTEIGTNAKLNEFCAIMGLCNLQYIDQSISRRKDLCEEYEKKLKDIEGVRLFEKKKDVERNYGYFSILIEDQYMMSRDELYTSMKDKGVYTRKYFYPLTSDHLCFKGEYKGAELSCARSLAKRILVLPLYERMGRGDIGRIIKYMEGN